MASIDSFLKKIYLFQTFTDQEIGKIVKISEEKFYSPGQDIFVAGQKADAFYVIKMGTVKISSTKESGNELNLATLGSGFHFGEIPFVDGGTRSATAQATENSTLLEINYKKLADVLQAEPVLAAKLYKELAHFLAARLRVTTENYQQVHDIKLKHF